MKDDGPECGTGYDDVIPYEMVQLRLRQQTLEAPAQCNARSGMCEVLITLRLRQHLKHVSATRSAV